jgi:hypothetical protein
MSSPPDEQSGADPLEPVLRDVEAELRSRLREACEAEASGVSSESAVEIRRLEDSLLAAAVAAEQTIALRRRIDQRRSETRAAGEIKGTQQIHVEPGATSEVVPRVREFRDPEGQLWRAWPVTPGEARAGRTAQRYLGEFHKGWICFEALEGNARRRLPKQPEHWTELKELELCQLLDQAINAPERRRH